MTITLLFCVVLIGSFFVLPSTYSYQVTCSSCDGNGTVICGDCHGSGLCWVCGGTGRISYMPPGDQWCGACQGTGVCSACGGDGYVICGECHGEGYLAYWQFTLTGSSIAISGLNILGFLAGFSLGYVLSSFYLSFNEWVYDVEDMNFWFNPSFNIWAFAKDHKRWAKYQVVGNAVITPFLGILLFLAIFTRHYVSDFLLPGFLFSLIITGVFAYIFYKAYATRLEEQKLEPKSPFSTTG